MSDETKKTPIELKIGYTVVIFLFVLLGFVVGVVYDETGGRTWENWAQIGDTFNPVVSLLAACLVAIGLYITARDFKHAREEFRKTANNLEDANKLEESQRQLDEFKGYMERSIESLQNVLDKTVDSFEVYWKPSTGKLEDKKHLLSLGRMKSDNFRIRDIWTVWAEEDRVSHSELEYFLDATAFSEVQSRLQKSKVENEIEGEDHREVSYVLTIGIAELFTLHRVITGLNEVLDELDSLPDLNWLKLFKREAYLELSRLGVAPLNSDLYLVIRTNRVVTYSNSNPQYFGLLRKYGAAKKLRPIIALHDTQLAKEFSDSVMRVGSRVSREYAKLSDLV